MKTAGYNELVSELAFAVDKDTATKNTGNIVLTVLGDEGSPYVKALKRKCTELGIHTNEPEVSGSLVYSYVADMDTYIGAFPTSHFYGADIDHIVTPGTSCVAEACSMVLSSLKRVGENVLIVGRGHSVKGLAQVLIDEDFTVTVCHSRTKDFSNLFRSADKIVFTASEWFYNDYDALKKDCVIIDVSGATKGNNHLVNKAITNIGKLTVSITANRAVQRRNQWL